MDVIPLDASLVKGSHGRITDMSEDGPVLISSDAGLLPDGAVSATEVKNVILAHIFRGTWFPKKTVPMPLEQCEECAPEGFSIEGEDDPMAIAGELLHAAPPHAYLQNSRSVTNIRSCSRATFSRLRTGSLSKRSRASSRIAVIR